MEDNNKEKRKIPNLVPSKGPKFNIYWVYGIIAVILIGLQFFPFTKASKLISFEQVNQDMLQSEDVQKLVVVNKEYVEVFIKPDRLQLEKYKEVATTNFNTVNPGPHYRFKILSVDDFTRKLGEAETAIKVVNPAYHPIEVYPENRTDWFNAVGWLLPILLLVAIWLFIMRRMTGGVGGPGGQIFNFV